MKTFLRHFGFALLCLLLTPLLQAAPGADNPLGPTGEYNGSIDTAGSYDPYTGNAKRVIDDLTVTGSLGAYPLKWTRVLNTRNPSPWTHNYQWGLWVKPWAYYHQYPELYEGPGGQVNYPDGRIVTLDIADQPNHYDDITNAVEIQDRIAYTGNGNFDLLMRDGGKVRFEHVGTISGGNKYLLIATQIIDPYGLVTTLTRDGSGRLWKITEPGGRYLQINYTNGYWTSVQAYSATGQLIETVSYIWQNNNLAQVNYDDTTHATYTYGASNVGEIPGNILIRTCDDVRFAGPMKRIEYEYMPAGGPYQVAFGQVKKEKNLTTHQTVSEVIYPPNPGVPIPDSYFQRTEIRGDLVRDQFGNSVHPTRLFQYSNDGNGLLKSYTDFKNHTTQITYPATETWWLTGRKSVTDARLNTTSTDTEINVGAIMKITYPSTGSNDNPTIEFTYSDSNNPYYMTGRKDENGDWTIYERDEYNRIKKISYPDHSTEEFTYNNFDQVLTHKLRSGGTETFEYDNQPPPAIHGLKTKHTDAMVNATTYQYYPSGANTDRLWKVTDPLNHTTTYEYNQRGQVTKVIHPDNSYSQSGYNDDGTLAWSADENHLNAWMDGHEIERTRYEYDEYKRVTAVTNPGETVPATSYYGLDWSNPLVHTTNCVKYTISPMGKNVVFDYDANFRKIDQVIALGNAADESWTWFDYDEVGNLNWTRDLRWNVTTFSYDARNRKIWMDDPIASNRNTNHHTMEWEYDGVGKKKKETRADDAFRSWIYDVPNSTTWAIDWRMSVSEPALTTTYTRDATDTLEQVFDAKGAGYTFRFDYLHRRTSRSYPVDATGASRSETFEYDAAGNLSIYMNAAGRYKHLNYSDSYDSRNRLRHSAWNASHTSTDPDGTVGQEVRTDYDDAGRMTKIQTNGGETTVAFGYDDANRKISEDQTLAGYPTRRVVTPRDGDGNRTKLEMYTNGTANYGAYYDYTDRNQLAHIYYDSNHTPWFTYAYDVSGNMVKRKDELAGVNDSINAPSAYYDGLNRPTIWENSRAGDVWFAQSHYQYDKAGREVATWRDEQASKGEYFKYLPNGQLEKAYYNASQVSTGTPSGESGKTDYVYTPDRLNRQSVTENGVVTNYSYGVYSMNQIKVWGGQTATYDGNFNFASMGGWLYSYDAESRLTGLDTGPTPRARFVYDGLGRCVKRTVGGVTTVINYDDWKPIMEWDSPTHWVAWNLYGPGPDEILWRHQAGVAQLRYHHDVHGNVTALLNYAGTVIERYTYDAFGRPTVTNDDGTGMRGSSNYGNRFMFQGREYFPELGLYDYRHRFYDPWMGRFLQTDPIGFDAGDMNLFRYCGDDPVDRSDPMGLSDLNYVPEWDVDIHHDINSFFGRGWYSRWMNGETPDKMVVASGHGARGYAINANVTKSAFEAFGNRRIPIPKEMRLDIKQLVNDIKKLDNYTATKPVRLDICYAGFGGSKSVAQQVANGLVTNQVTANTDKVRPDTGNGSGEWRDFNSPESKRPTDVVNKSIRTYHHYPGQPSLGASGLPSNEPPAPTAKWIDLTHQATGVPSLGAEAVNFVRGRP